MKKSILLFAIFAIVSALFCSCKPSAGDNGGKPSGGDAGNNSQNNVTDTRFFGEGKQFYFVAGDGVTLGDNVSKLYYQVLYSTYQYPTYITSMDEGGECEIVFGNTDRPISKEAYRQLDGCYTGASNESVWLIYVKNNSVCIAFDTNQALKRAFKYVEDNLVRDDFGSKTGVVAYENFDRLEVAREERASKQAESLANLTSTVGAEGVEALKKLYSLYDERLYIWMANLYCPDVGGFYYSNSGRNTEGFLPDIESTKQVLSFISTSGMLEDYPTTNYGAAILKDYPEIAEQILNFAISLQAEDGYFYHPQWSKAPITSRLGRDLGNAKQVITAFGGTARYPYPDVQIPETDGDAVGVSAKLTGRLSNSAVVAVSKVVATAAPAYLQSLDKWKAYIDGLGIDKGNSYGAGNTLNSLIGMIRAAGQEYVDYLINYLNETQCENGTWEDEISYNSVNGLMKLSSVYSGLNALLPRLKEAANSSIVRCIDLSLRPEGFDTTCDNYNPWYTLAIITSMAKGDERNEIRQMIYDNFVEMVNSTAIKVARYKKEDGSFSYNIDHTSATSQGAVVAVSGTNEGDVNATCLSSSGPLTYMFKCLGVSMVPLFYSDDFEIFMDTICDLGSIIKDPAPDPKPITFNNFDVSIDQTVNGIISNPDEMIQITVRDKDMENSKYIWVDSEVVKSPDPRTEGDNALKFEVITKPCRCSDDPCTCKKVATTASNIYTTVQNNAIMGDAWVADFDFYLDSWGPGTNARTIAQLSFSEVSGGGPSISLNMDTYTGTDGKNYIRLWDNLAGLDGMKNSSLVEGIPAKEWVNLRFELYKTQQLIPDENSGEIKQYLAHVCKIFVNGEYVAESDAAQVKADGTTDKKGVGGFSISGYRTNHSCFYLDNLLVYKDNTEYVCEEEPGNGVLDNMAVDKTQTVATFNDGKTSTYYLKNLAVPGYINYTVEEIAGKTALHVDKYGAPPSAQTYTQATISNPADKGECYTYETKIYYDAAKMTSGNYVSQFSVSANNSLSFLGFSLKFCGTYVEVIHNKNYLNGSSIENSGVVKGIDGEALHLPVDCWFTFKLEFYRAEVASESMVKIYIGDANGENMELCAEFNAYKTDSTVDIQRFVFTHYRAVANISVYLDDISFTRSDKEFVSDLPDENVDGFDDGYVSGEVRISDNTADSAYAGSDSVSAAKDPKNNTNNVMKIESNSSSEAPYVITIKHSGSQITNGLSAFETKLFVESAESGTFATIAFVGTNGAVQELTLNKGTDGKVYIGVPDGYTLTSNDLVESNSKNRLALGAWNTLRIEFTNADDASDAFAEVFINGSSIGKLVGYKSTQNVHTVTVAGAGVNSVMYLDDVSYREFLLAKEPVGGAGANGSTTVTEGETFDKLGGNLVGDGSDSKVKFGKGTCSDAELTYTQPDDTIIVTKDPTGGENDVLMFRDGSTSSHSTLYLAYSGNQVANGISVFETKLYIPKSEIVGSSIVAQLSFNKGRTAQFNLDLNAYSDKSQVYFALSDTEGAETGSAITTDAWHTLRLEYYNYTDTTKSCVKVYIDNLYAGSIAKGTAADCNAFFWKGYSLGLSTIYFDNMSLTEKKAD